MKNNPDWKVYLDTVEAASFASFIFGHDVLTAFIEEYPKRLQPAVALALSLAKWYLIVVKYAEEPRERESLIGIGAANCGCCAYYEDACTKCSLGPERIQCMFKHAPGVSYAGQFRGKAGTYNHILQAYTKAFSKLSSSDKQAAKKESE